MSLELIRIEHLVYNHDGSTSFVPRVAYVNPAHIVSIEEAADPNQCWLTLTALEVEEDGGGSSSVLLRLNEGLQPFIHRVKNLGMLVVWGELEHRGSKA